MRQRLSSAATRRASLRSGVTRAAIPSSFSARKPRKARAITCASSRSLWQSIRCTSAIAAPAGISESARSFQPWVRSAGSKAADTICARKAPAPESRAPTAGGTVKPRLGGGASSLAFPTPALSQLGGGGLTTSATSSRAISNRISSCAKPYCGWLGSAVIASQSSSRPSPDSSWSWVCGTIADKISSACAQPEGCSTSRFLDWRR